MSADIMYDEMMAKAKKLAKDSDLEGSMKYLKLAKGYKSTDKVKRRIQQLQDVLAEHDEAEDNDENFDSNFEVLKNGLSVENDVWGKLYPHQRIGLQWMWDAVHLGNPNLPSSERVYGGLLSDDMGLGKTIQVAAFISALIDNDEARHFLIIVPTSLIPNWEKELRKWVPAVEIYKYTGDSGKAKRNRELFRAQHSRHAVVIASYGVCRTSVETLNTKARNSSNSYGERYEWPYVILDEAHNIKNASKQQKAIFQLNAKHRLLLTGTPIMNKMTDFYYLMQFLGDGKLLQMNLTMFKQNYQNRIETGRTKCARPHEVELANMLSIQLRDATEYWILRRTKDQVKNEATDKIKNAPEEPTSTGNKAPDFPELPPKNDFVLWCIPTEKQLKVYKDFLESDDVKQALMIKKSPLVQCTVLKKICDHPRRMANSQCRAVGLINESFNETIGNECAANSVKNVELETLLEESGKMLVLYNLLGVLLPEKILIFSQSIKILDIIAKVLEDKGTRYIRMDGKDKTSIRDIKVQEFQDDKSIKVFLLTTGVGAVGLTLTAASRVIIFDPDWNPSRDDQAVDRAYRIGQTKPVVVFRLITCSTIEEKIYRRQLFKKSIITQNNGENDDPTRLFKGDEIWKLFDPPGDAQFSETQKQLQVVAEKRQSYPVLDELLDKVECFQKYHSGVHDHNLVFEAPDVPKEKLSAEEKTGVVHMVESIKKGDIPRYYPGATRGPLQPIQPKANIKVELPPKHYPLFHTEFVHPTKRNNPYGESPWGKNEVIVLDDSMEDIKNEIKEEKVEPKFKQEPIVEPKRKVETSLSSLKNNSGQIYSQNIIDLTKLDNPNEVSDDDDIMDVEIISGPNKDFKAPNKFNIELDDTLDDARPNFNSTRMVRNPLIQKIVDEDLNDSLSNMSFEESEEPEEPGELLKFNFDLDSSATTDPLPSAKTGPLVNDDAEMSDDDETCSEGDLMIDEKTRFEESTNSENITREEASGLLFGSDADDDSDEDDGKPDSNQINIPASQSINDPSGFIDSSARSSIIDETFGSDDNPDSEAEMQKILDLTQSGKKKVRRRSQLPPRPETDDETDIESDIDDSFIDDYENLSRNRSTVTPPPKAKNKFGRIQIESSDDEFEDEATPPSKAQRKIVRQIDSDDEVTRPPKAQKKFGRRIESEDDTMPSPKAHNSFVTPTDESDDETPSIGTISDDDDVARKRYILSDSD